MAIFKIFILMYWDVKIHVTLKERAAVLLDVDLSCFKGYEVFPSPFIPSPRGPRLLWSSPVMCPDVSFKGLSHSGATALTSLGLFFHRAAGYPLTAAACDRGQEGGRSRRKILFPLVPYFNSYGWLRYKMLLKDNASLADACCWWLIC